MSYVRVVLVVLLTLATGASALVAGPPPAVAAPGDVVRIHVLSGRADVLSGGDAYVEVVAPAGADARQLTVQLDGRDVTDAFAVRRDERFTGLISGLRLGDNQLTATLPDGTGARLTLRNHPKGGPVFGGPQIQPWHCQTAEEGLGEPTDAKCNADTRYEFFYKSTSGGALQAYDPENPPGDVATTWTDQAEEVPFIVRRETGTIDRSIYSIAVLYDPEQGWKPWDRQKGWNQKVHVPFGGSCAPRYRQDPPGDVMLERPLSKGFAVATSGLNTLGQNCNPVISAEALMMTKEHIVETYGEIRYTMSEGCSGGAIQQHNIASGYPGLLDGIMPSCTYPDVYTTAMEVLDCKMLNNYFETTSPHLWPVAQQRAFVSGHQSPAPCQSWDKVFDFDASAEPDRENTFTACGLEGEMYHPQDNPDGVRCNVTDYAIAVWGERPPRVWSDVEKQLNHGFARLAADNTGVQYGLTALLSGQITPEQFVDLNRKIGGLDIDAKHIEQRSVADPGSLEIAYRSGQVTNGRQLATVPIIDLRGTSNQEIHTDYHSYGVRERLVAANGHHDNHAIWTNEKSIAGDPAVNAEAFDLMDQWLAAIEADDGGASLETKVVRNKPAEAVDTCWINGNRVTDRSTCRAAYPYYASPRVAAGGPLSHDVLKCRLKPVDRGDYDVAFRDSTWQNMGEVFPEGVCDWSKDGVDQQTSLPWMSYADGPGGRPLGRAPISVPFGGDSDVCVDAGPAVEYADRLRARETHRANVDCVIAHRISVGSDSGGALQYRPLQPVTRAQMASFIVNSLHAAGLADRLPEPGRDQFADIAGTAHADNINRLARAGLISGRTARRFAPNGRITRSQMATFMVAAAEFAGAALPSGAAVFRDVDAGNVHAGNIHAGYAAGLFGGTTEPTATTRGEFSPRRDVARDQMATFLIRLLRYRT